MELLLGCGSTRDRRLAVNGRREWSKLVAVDFNDDHKPDHVADLNVTPWAFAEDNSFDEVHAYELLEHLGRQGDFASFFATFGEIWRILKPGGYLAATCPSYRSMWAWGDPGHTRVLTSGSLVFLDQEQYHIQVGHTAMADYRFIWKGDFLATAPGCWVREDADSLEFIIQAVKPARTFSLTP